jgi:hypothetical protein
LNIHHLRGGFRAVRVIGLMRGVWRAGFPL